MPAVEGDEESIGTSGMTIANSSRVGGPISLHTAIESKEQQARDVSVELTATEKRAEEAEKRESEKDKQIEKLLEESASRSEENEDLTERLSSLESHLRYMIASAVVILGLILIGIATISPWPWLEQHSHKLGLYVVAVLLLGASAWAVIDRKRRNAIFVAVVIGAVLALIPVIDGAP